MLSPQAKIIAHICLLIKSREVGVLPRVAETREETSVERHQQTKHKSRGNAVKTTSQTSGNCNRVGMFAG